MHRTLLPSRAVGLVLSALLGGGVALGGAAAVGRLGEKTTVIREELAPTSSEPAGFQNGREPFWDLNGCGLLSGVIAYVATVKPPE